MSVRRATAPDPNAIKALYQQQEEQQHAQKDALLSKQQHDFAVPAPIHPSASPLPLHSPSKDQLASAPLPASNANPLALMTERQQLAFLMRATSEGEDAPKRRRRGHGSEGSDSSDESDSDSDSSSSSSSSSGDSDSSSDSSDSDDDDDSTAAPAQASIPAPAPTPVPTVAAIVIPPPQPQPQSVQPPSSSSKSARAPATDHSLDHLPRPIRRPLEYALWDAQRQRQWDGVKDNPNAYYYKYLPPGVRAKDAPVAATTEVDGSDAASPSPAALAASAPWSSVEKSLFLYSLECYPPEGKWGLFSLNVPGRTGLECEQFFRELVAEGLVSGGGTSHSGSSRKPPVNQPIRFEKGTLEKFRCESTPYVVARGAEQVAAHLSAEDAALRAQELETAVAMLCMQPMPGTEGLDANMVHVPRYMLQLQQSQAQRRSEMGPPSTPHQSSESKRKRHHSPTSSSSSSSRAPARDRAAPLSATRSSPRTATSDHPSAAAEPGKKKGSLRHAWSTEGETIGAGVAVDSSNVQMEAQGGLELSEGNAQQQRARAASDALMACMSDISASRASASTSAAASAASVEDVATPPSSSSPSSSSASASVLGSKRKGTDASSADEVVSEVLRPSRKRAATDHSGSGSGRGGIKVREASARDRATLFAFPAVGRQVLATAESGPRVTVTPATADGDSAPAATPLFPFASFSIPAHTPYVSAHRHALLAQSDARLRVRRAAQPEPAQRRLDFPSMRFEPERAGLGEEVLPTLDERGDLVMHDMAAASGSAAAVSPRSEPDDHDPSLPLYSAELERLEASYRARLRKLAAHQAQQLARARMVYGVDVSEAATVVGADVSRAMLQHTRVGGPGAKGLPIQPGGPFEQATPHTFSNGCRRLLAEYFNTELHSLTSPTLSAMSSPSDPLLGPILLPPAKARTYGEALGEIGANYKMLLKELQREHQTGRDVLNSLKKTGLLR